LFLSLFLFYHDSTPNSTPDFPRFPSYSPKNSRLPRILPLSLILSHFSLYFRTVTSLSSSIYASFHHKKNKSPAGKIKRQNQ
jgi:hypothetical protein